VVTDKVPAEKCHAQTKTCKAKIDGDMALFTKFIAGKESPAPSAPALQKTEADAASITQIFPHSMEVCGVDAKTMATTETEGGCPVMAVVDAGNASGGIPLDVTINNQQQIKKILSPYLHFKTDDKEELLVENTLNKVLNLFFSEAKAVGILDALGVAGNQAIQYVISTSQSLSTTLDLNLLIPKRRAIVWGVLSALSLASSMATGSEISTIEGNISKIDGILKSMNSLQNGVDQANNLAAVKPIVNANNPLNKDIPLNSNIKLGINTNQPSNYDLVANGGAELPCITGSDSANCKSLSQKMVGLNTLDSMPAFTQSQVGNITKLADGLSGASSISASTLELSKNLAGKQNALANELIKQQKKLQEKLKAVGSKIDLASESNKLEASIRASVKKGLDSRKTSAAAIYASFGGASSGPSLPNNISNDSSLNSKGKGESAGGGGFGASNNSFNSNNFKEDDGIKLEGTDQLSDGAEANKADTITLTDGKGGAASMDDYVLGNDINQDKDASIFNLISNRYQRSGYPRLFKQIK
jgi:hypothetical protein